MNVQEPKSSTIERKAFDQVGALAAASDPGGHVVGRLFKGLFAGFKRTSRDWTVEAGAVVELQRELRARSLLYAIAITCVLLVLWSGLTQIDEVTRGEGKIIPIQQLQVVQSVDGGVVEEVFVREGDTVAKDALLVRIDPTRFVANLQEGSVKVFALRAKVQRLSALINERPYTPQSSSELSDAERLVLAQEQDFYQESLKELNQRVSIAREQLSQRQRELDEMQARLRATASAREMSAKELSVTRPLLASGAVSEMDILRLERDLSAADGEHRQTQARVNQVKASVQEAHARIAEVAHVARNQWRAELSEASAQLNSLDQSVVGLADRVKYSEIRSPVSGTIQRVLYNTIGGVVQPGHSVLEIVPSDDRLVVEAKIAPKDIAFLRPGLPVTIKLHAYDFSIYGGLSATLQHISADTITDERDNTYYLVRAVSTDNDFSQRLQVIPGMTAQVDILTGKRSVLAYLLKPILRAKSNSLSER